ncbi:arginine--tRNA ligase [Candidatus Kaiserbacteria bacterium]|nr:arginine--tRNA ligase [Candidatus Kaiserbacteria bacterium]
MVREYLQQLEFQISDWLKNVGVSSPVVLIERSVDVKFGEFSTNVAMRYAKELKKNPQDLASDLADFLKEKRLDFLADVTAVQPGFVNFYLTPEAKTKHVLSILSAGNKFGNNESHKSEKWVIEHTSPNPNKAMHIGHLRINLIGMGIVRLMKAAGAEVVADGIYNDRGISIAKVMYGYLAHRKKTESTPTDIHYWALHKEEWVTPLESDIKPDVFVSDTYVLGEQDFSNDERVEKSVRQMVVDWEANDEVTWELWRQILSYVYEGNERVFQRLGSHWDKVWYEHEHYQKGKDYVLDGLEKGVFKKLEDGAVITKLEDDYGLSDTVVLKNDGTSLYLTQDIALTDLKKTTYKADKLVWVVGPEQSLHMKQLFAVCEQLGIGNREDFTHVPYGKVGLKSADGSSAKMSSRDGTVVLADDVIDEVKETIIKRFEDEERHQPENREEIAEKLALAAVKFGFIKMDKMQDIDFDIEHSIDVHGDSGLYVMYTFVRAQSILRKSAGFDVEGVNQPSELGEEAELVRSLLYFEDVVAKSIDDLSVHHVAQYLLQLCSDFNGWYAQESILDGSEREMYKLAIVKSVAVTIQNGLALLGISTIDEM